MSKMIPLSVVRVLRDYADVSVGLFGIDCILFIPNNLNVVDDLGVYARPQDITYEEYTAQLFIDWHPNVHRLRKLGVFSEDESPMIARMSSKAKSVESGEEIVNVEVVPRSYVKIPIQYIPNDIDIDEFELVNVHIEGMHDAEVVRMWKLVPRRVKEQ